jgi:hypothetical protein
MKRRIVEEFGIVVPNKPGTGCAGGHDVVASTEVFDEFSTYVLGIVPKAGIEGWLAATGLFCIVLNITTQFLQQFHHVEGCLGI